MDFKSALTKVCQDFSKDIIFQRRIISILDDYKAFKDVPYYKLFYKTILNVGDMAQLISLNPNIRAKAIYAFLAVSGLDENKVKSFISFISECYYGFTSSSTQTPPDTNDVSKQVRLNQQSECNKNENEIKESSNNVNEDNSQSQISFMGIPLGIPLQNFADKILKLRKGIIYTGGVSCIPDDYIDPLFKTVGSELGYEIAYNDDVNIQNRKVYAKFSFAGFEKSEILVYYTPYSRIVYKVVVDLHYSQFLFNKEIIERVKSLLNTKFGEPVNDNIPLTNNEKLLNGKCCNYIFANGLNLKYYIYAHNALTFHCISYSSDRLRQLADKEILDKINEVVDTYNKNEDQKHKDALSDL